MRKWQRHAGIVAAGLMLAGMAGAATFDRGLIPKSTPSSDTSAGTGLTGDVSVVFDDYDTPTFKTEHHIATTPIGRSAWFKDPDGNTIAIFQPA